MDVAEQILPPGQRAVDGFPRFGTHLERRPPPLPAEFAVEVRGAVREPVRLTRQGLADVPRRELVADFHCVAGWTATGLRWEGFGFADVYRRVVEPQAGPRAGITHLVFEGLDGYRAIVTLEDALAEDVLLADRLDGRALGPDHGAPVRLVSPRQYGYVNTKHLCAIELYAGAPALSFHRSPGIDRRLRLVMPHARARAWNEERHRHLPAWMLRLPYRLLIGPIRSLSARGSAGAGSR